MTYQEIFNELWQQYITENPAAKCIHDLLSQRGETVVNDHIALRTFNDSRVNIETLAKPFIDCGYQECGQYHFELKKLFAKHYEHPDKLAPKVFISELLLESFSHSLQETIQACLNQTHPTQLETLYSAGTPWQAISYETYQALLSESEYAAWMYAYGYRANHFTVFINALKTFDSVEDINTFLIDNDFSLNTSGGKIKGSPTEHLEQSSIMAEKQRIQFIEGKFDIPSCYYEFAKRYPIDNGKLYQGFVAKSADKIFESTNTGDKHD
jgi:hypothetical protein